MKKSQLDRAIDQLENEKAVLQLAIDRLRQQATQRAAKMRNKPAAVAALGEHAS